MKQSSTVQLDVTFEEGFMNISIEKLQEMINKAKEEAAQYAQPIVRITVPDVQPTIQSIVPSVQPAVQSSIQITGPSESILSSIQPTVYPVQLITSIQSIVPSVQPIIPSVQPTVSSAQPTVPIAQPAIPMCGLQIFTEQVERKIKTKVVGSVVLPKFVRKMIDKHEMKLLKQLGINMSVTNIVDSPYLRVHNDIIEFNVNQNDAVLPWTTNNETKLASDAKLRKDFEKCNKWLIEQFNEQCQFNITEMFKDKVALLDQINIGIIEVEIEHTVPAFEERHRCMVPKEMIEYGINNMREINSSTCSPFSIGVDTPRYNPLMKSDNTFIIEDMENLPKDEPRRSVAIRESLNALGSTYAAMKYQKKAIMIAPGYTGFA